MKNGWLDATLCNPKKQLHNLFVVIPAIATTHFPSEFATREKLLPFFSLALWYQRIIMKINICLLLRWRKAEKSIAVITLFCVSGSDILLAKINGYIR